VAAECSQIRNRSRYGAGNGYVRVSCLSVSMKRVAVCFAVCVAVCVAVCDAVCDAVCVV